MIFLISFRFSSLNALQWTWCMQNSNHAGRKGAEFSLVFKGTPNFLPQLAPPDNFPWNRSPLFARKEMLLFLMSIWPKSAQHRLPSVLSAIPGALIYVTEINSDPAELRWCLWRLAGSLLPHRSWAAGGASTGVRSGMNLRSQHQCLISTNLCYQSWNKRKWDKMLNQWSLFHSPQDLALNHEGITFSTLSFQLLHPEELSPAENKTCNRSSTSWQ